MVQQINASIRQVQGAWGNGTLHLKQGRTDIGVLDSDLPS